MQQINPSTTEFIQPTLSDPYRPSPLNPISASSQASPSLRRTQHLFSVSTRSSPVRLLPPTQELDVSRVNVYAVVYYMHSRPHAETRILEMRIHEFGHRTFLAV